MSNTETPTGLDHTGQVLDWLATRFALAGGLIISLLAAITVTSVIGRSLFNHAILGDFEITEIGLAIGVFLFLPYCQLRRGHVVVDFFTMTLSDRARAVLDGIGNFIFSLLAATLIWRLYLAGLDKHAYDEGSMLLDIKTWWAYLIIVPATGLLLLCCLQNLALDIRSARHHE